MPRRADPQELAVVRRGLAQMGRPGNRRLCVHLRAGKPVYLRGAVISRTGGYG